MTTRIWYYKPEHSRDLGCGLEFARSRGLALTPATLSDTHVLLKELPASPNPNAVFLAMQGEVWSPNGEAAPLIRSLGLAHTSMSVGDIVDIDGRFFFCDTFDFVEIF